MTVPAAIARPCRHVGQAASQPAARLFLASRIGAPDGAGSDGIFPSFTGFHGTFSFASFLPALTGWDGRSGRLPDVEFFEGGLVGLVVGRELGHLVQEGLQRQPRTDGEGGLVDPFAGHGTYCPGTDEDFPIGVGQ